MPSLRDDDEGIARQAAERRQVQVVVMAVGDQHLLAYVIEGCAPMRPRLIPFVLENKTLLVMARHLLYSCSESPRSLYTYTEAISLYSRFLQVSPDRIMGSLNASPRWVGCFCTAVSRLPSC